MNFLGGHMDNLGNQQRGPSVVGCPILNRPLTRAYASTSKNAKNYDVVVSCTLFVLDHLTLTLLNSRSTHSFIFVVFVDQARFAL